MWDIWKALIEDDISKALFDEDYAREQFLIAERAENERKTAARVEKAVAETEIRVKNEAKLEAEKKAELKFKKQAELEAEKKVKAMENELALKLLAMKVMSNKDISYVTELPLERIEELSKQMAV